MKLNKIFAVALAVLAMTSCDDNNAEDYPTFLGSVNSASGVTVGLPATFSVNENEIPAFIPVTVTGEANGKVVVTVQVKELASTPADTEPAKLGEHFNITSYTVNIPAGETQGFIEMTPVWETGVINDDRVFELSIVKVEGASVSNADCQVTLVNVDDPYTSMCGTWTLRGVDRSGEAIAYRLNVTTVDPSSEDYGHVLYGFGMFGESDYLLPLVNFEFDEVSGTGTVEIGYGYMMTDGKAFNYGLEAPAIPVCMFRSSQGVTTNHQAVCTFDGSYNTITIPQDAVVYGGLFYTTTMGFSGYGVGQIGQMTLTR